MQEKTITVKVQSDHLELQARVRTPILAVAELIWNGLDADATEVKVHLSYNALGGLHSIVVEDNGHGIEYKDVVPAFEKLGGSWKRGQQRSKGDRRFLHGKAGRGRFRAFSLGNEVKWSTRFRDNSSIMQYTIRGNHSNLGVFIFNDPLPSKQNSTGTEVTIKGFDKNFPSLDRERAFQELTEHFALYLHQYQDVQIMGIIYLTSLMRRIKIPFCNERM